MAELAGKIPIHVGETKKSLTIYNQPKFHITSACNGLPNRYALCQPLMRGVMCNGKIDPMKTVESYYSKDIF